MAFITALFLLFGWQDPWEPRPNEPTPIIVDGGTR